MPVYGHTRLFFKLAGDVALLFPSDWKELRIWPNSRTLGECFAIFIWGQWRVVIKGPQNAALVMNGQELKEGWPWNPPVTLLGKSCVALQQENDPDAEEFTIPSRPFFVFQSIQKVPCKRIPCQNREEYRQERHHFGSSLVQTTNQPATTRSDLEIFEASNGLKQHIEGIDTHVLVFPF